MTTILVVEDDPGIRANIVDLLEVEGFTPVSAKSGPEGLEAFRRVKPDLVLCDVKLPGFDGFTLLEALRKEPEGSDTPFVFLSAHAERENVRRGMTLGADDYIPKPFTARELLDAVQGRLSRHKRIQAGTPRIEEPARGAASMAPEPGEERCGNYRILAPLGKGGMGAVFVGEHVLIGRQVAIKLLLPEVSKSKESVQRFFNEARSAAAIHDPGIVDVFDFGYDERERAYLVMELLQGESLRTRLAREPKPALPWVRHVGVQIAEAVAAAHAQRIVHRDLKPDNVFLANDRQLPFGARVKVLDFGAAKLAKSDDVTVTRSGALIGTPLYMSPEQCRGTGEIDARADVYALGCMLFEMLCGRPPFVSGGIGMIVASHIYEPAPDPRSLVPELPPALAELLSACLQKQPELRPQSMHELARRLSA